MNENRNHIRQRIIQVVSGVFRLPAEVIERGVSPDGIEGWDSNKHVELVVALEEHFQCIFEPEEVPELTSLEQMEEIVSRHG